MGVPFQLSAKNLGSMALDSFCERCFWIKLRLRNRLPFQVFPSIFSKIDSFTKDLVKAHFDIIGHGPTWLSPLGPLCNYIEPPTFHAFRVLDKATGITLTGSPDAIFVRPDNSIVIGDFKTSKADLDPLIAMYACQLAVYS